MKKIILSLLFSLVALYPINVFASQRLALVIGNGNYNITDGKLANPIGDAKAIASRLEALGFEVILKTDLVNKETMELAVDAFSEQLSGKEIGLFYYAGHALQVNDHNYLMPINAAIKKASQVKHRALDSSYLLEQMGQYKPKLSIVILDACRDNPFPKDTRSSASRGLGRMEAPSDMLLAFATKPGDTAKDGEGQHSPYTEMLLTYLKQAPHIPIQTFFNQVGVAVETKTHNSQSPRLEMSPLHYSFCFADCTDQEISPIVIQTHPAPAPHYFSQQNNLAILVGGAALFSIALIYGLYSRQQPRSVKTALKNQKNKIQPDLSSCSPHAFAYLCDANTHTAIGEIANDTSIKIGRSRQSTIKLDHAALSAHHAEISWHPGSKTFLLQDKGSTNGTWIAQQPPLNKKLTTAIERGTVFHLGHQDQAYYIF